MFKSKSISNIIGGIIGLIALIAFTVGFFYLFIQFWNNDIDAIKLLVSWFVLFITCALAGGLGALMIKLDE